MTERLLTPLVNRRRLRSGRLYVSLNEDARFYHLGSDGTKSHPDIRINQRFFVLKRLTSDSEDMMSYGYLVTFQDIIGEIYPSRNNHFMEVLEDEEPK